MEFVQVENEKKKKVGSLGGLSTSLERMGMSAQR